MDKSEEDEESIDEKEIKLKKEDLMSINSEETEFKEEPKKLIVMLIPKTKKDLPLPKLPDLYHFDFQLQHI